MSAQQGHTLEKISQGHLLRPLGPAARGYAVNRLGPYKAVKGPFKALTSGLRNLIQGPPAAETPQKWGKGLGSGGGRQADA